MLKLQALADVGLEIGAGSQRPLSQMRVAQRRDQESARLFREEGDRKGATLSLHRPAQGHRQRSDAGLDIVKQIAATATAIHLYLMKLDLFECTIYDLSLWPGSLNITFIVVCVWLRTN